MMCFTTPSQLNSESQKGPQMKITKKSPSTSNIAKLIVEDSPSIRILDNGEAVLMVATGKYLDIVYYIQLSKNDLEHLSDRMCLYHEKETAGGPSS